MEDTRVNYLAKIYSQLTESTLSSTYSIRRSI